MSITVGEFGPEAVIPLAYEDPNCPHTVDTGVCDRCIARLAPLLDALLSWALGDDDEDQAL